MFAARSRIFPCLPTYTYRDDSRSFVRQYFHRLCHLSLMDLQFSVAQLRLIFTDPNRLYAFSALRRGQKRHYARDDPSLLLLLLLFLGLTGAGYAGVTGSSGTAAAGVTLSPLLFFVVSGLFIIPVSYLSILYGHKIRIPCRKGSGPAAPQPSSRRHVKEDDLEIAFSFDVHCNGFFWYAAFALVFPLFLFPLLEILPSWLACLVAAALHCIGVTGYFFLLSCGYTALGFVDSPVILMLPAIAFDLFAMGCVVRGVNLTSVVISVMLAIT